MSACVADTHATIWFLLDQPRLSDSALRALEAAERGHMPIYVPSISLVEIAYLVEKGKLPQAAWDTVIDALSTPDRALTLAPLDIHVATALRSVSRDEVPDMPDRIIAATAIALGLGLVSRDGRIRSSTVQAIW